MDCSDRPRYPVIAALYHPPGGIIRHDAVVWGYARGASRLGVDIHQFTEVTGIDTAGGAVTGVRTYHKTPLPYPQIFDQHSGGRIAIVTCGGPFDASTGNYLDNIVVFAVPKG